MSGVVYSAHIGNSSVVMRGIVKLYLPKDSVVADLTYDKGVFWRKVSGIQVLKSDIERRPSTDIVCDALCSPYSDEFFDGVVLDPPYANGSTVARVDVIGLNYNTRSLRTPKEIVNWYSKATAEAHRILKQGGILIIKCQNMVNHGHQQPFQYEIFKLVSLWGFEFLDDFILMNPGKPQLRHRNSPQQHARKNHSVFLVFLKTPVKRKRLR